MKDLGTVHPGSTIYIEFDSFGASGESITLTGLAVTDVEVYKDGSTTQRSSDAGYTLLDTDGIDLDTVTGIHGLSISLADNTDAGFWAAGSHYRVVIASVTINTQTVTFTAATFRIGYPAAILNTTISTLTTQTSFTLTAGPAEDDALNGMWAIIHDVASGVQKAAVQILDYTGATKTVTLAAGATFTAAASDNFSVMGMMPLQPTTTGNKLDVSTGGEAGLDWANVGSQSTSVNLSATTVNLTNTLTTYTGNTPQTGDSYAIVNSGVHGNAAIKGYVDDIGVAGAGLTDLGGMSTTMKAQVESEANDALVAQNLDHLVKIAVDTNFATTVHLDSVIGHLADAGTTATFDRTTDSLEVLKDEHDTTQSSLAGLITTVGVAGAGLTAIDLPDQTMNITGNITGSLSGSVGSISGVTFPSNFAALGINASGHVSRVTLADTLTTYTGNTVQTGDAYSLLNSAMADSVPADGTRPSPIQAMYMMIQAMIEGSISGTTWTVKKVDGTTTLFTVTLDSSTTPTSKTRAT